MDLDPYMQCLCGSGKKLKWCCAKWYASYIKVFDEIQAGRTEAALALLDKLKEEGASPSYVESMRVFAFIHSERMEEAREVATRAIEQYPNSAKSFEAMGRLQVAEQDFEGSIGSFIKAIALCPAESTEAMASMWTAVGECHFICRRPLAAKAAFQRALKINPSLSRPAELLEDSRGLFPLLPHAVRHGGTLKSPDELAVFNEERRKRWDEALQAAPVREIDDLIRAFEYLTEDDPYDAAAWYNLGLSHAWRGNQAKAIHALLEYVKRETNFEDGAMAADLIELLRLGRGAEDAADQFEYLRTFTVEDPEAFVQGLMQSKKVVMAPQPNREILVLYVADRVPLERQDPLEMQVPIRWYAQVLAAGRVASIIAMSEENLMRAHAELEPFLANAWKLVENSVLPRQDASLYAEAFSIVKPPAMTAERFHEAVQQHVQQYFEEEWLKTPLNSLGGLRPLDACQKAEWRVLVEGKLRFAERYFEALHSMPLNLDRVRNKLGIESLRPTDLSGKRPADISAYSVAQLTELNPTELTDDELLTAYRTANALDAPRTALHFGEEMVQRSSLADKIDLITLYRRLILDRLEHGYRAKIPELLAQAFELDEREYQGEHRGELETLQAHIHLAEGQTDEACHLYRRVFDRDKENLDAIAGAVERLMSSGDYRPAREFAELGLERAKARRQRDFQEQFEEYVAATGARL